jgi:hypothetical protein
VRAWIGPQDDLNKPVPINVELWLRAWIELLSCLCWAIFLDRKMSFVFYRVSPLDKMTWIGRCLAHVDLWLRAWIELLSCLCWAISLDRKMPFVFYRMSSLDTDAYFISYFIVSFLVSLIDRKKIEGLTQWRDFCQCTTRHSFNVKKERLFHWTAAAWWWTWVHYKSSVRPSRTHNLLRMITA